MTTDIPAQLTGDVYILPTIQQTSEPNGAVNIFFRLYQTHFRISYNNIDYFIFRTITSDQQNVLPIEDDSLQSFPRTSLAQTTSVLSFVL